MRTLLIALTMLASIHSPTRADVILDFEGIGLNNGDVILQTYGDTPLSNVSYRELDGFGGNSVALTPELLFWSNGYGDLNNVVWAPDGAATTNVSEIRIQGLSGNLVRLNSFQTADWDGSATSQTFRVYDGQYNLLFERTGVDVNDVTHDTILPAVSSATLNLQWDYGWGVALDNISYDVVSVPEPGSLALLTLGVSFVCGTRAFSRRHAD